MSGMDARSFLLGLVCVVGACGEHSHGADSLVLLDSASDEAWGVLRDAVVGGNATVDTVHSAMLIAPADAQELAATAPAVFRWSLPGARAVQPHGVETGRFVWLALELGADKASEIDVVALTSMSFAPDAAVWEQMVAAGSVTATVYTATMDDGAIAAGPFRSSPVTFRIVK